MQYKTQLNISFKNHWGKRSAQFPIIKLEIDRFYGIKLFAAILGFSICFSCVSKKQQKAFDDLVNSINNMKQEW